jgi:hypothetical protein
MHKKNQKKHYNKETHQIIYMSIQVIIKFKVGVIIR